MGHYITSEEFRVLIELIHEISAELDFQKSAHKACEVVAKTLGMPYASLFIKTDTKELEWVAGYGWKFDESRIACEEELIGSGRSLEKSSDLSKINNLMVRDLIKSHKLKSFICAPLTLDRKTVGVIAAYSPTTIYFTAKQEEHLRIFSTPIALMIKNVLLHEQVKHLAETDELTGLYNRRRFLVELEEAKTAAKKEKKSLSLAMIDLDKFKEINDEYGHDVGDQYLKKTAHLIRECVREGDIPARLGGDEFCVLLPNTNERQAHEFSERVRHHFAENPFTLRGTPKVIGMSVGLETTDHDFESLLKKADEKMYLIKKKR